MGRGAFRVAAGPGAGRIGSVQRAASTLLLAWFLLVLGCGVPIEEDPTGGAGGEVGGSGGSGGSSSEGGTTGSGGTADGEGGQGGEGGDEPIDGCQGDEFCTGSKPFCAPDRQCKACLLDEHCPAETPACVEGSCTRCLDPTPCEGRGFCELESGSCVECRDHEDCVDGRCSEDHRCLECLADEDCGAAEVCEENVCVWGERCDEDNPCDAEKVCYRREQAEQFGFCRPRCEVLSQEGCADELRCDLHSIDEEGPVGACVEPNGGNVAGEACSAEARCEVGNLCVAAWGERYCAPYCDPGVEGSCGEGQSCDELRLTRHEGTITVCVEDALFCERDADCRDGKACSPFFLEEGTVLACAPPVGEGRGGDPCTFPNECASGICLAELGVCFGGCQESADCGEGASCLPVDFGDGLINACLRTCETEAQCGAGRGCSPFLSADRTELIGFCTPGPQPSGPGEACTPGSCRSGGCVFAERAGYCSSLCVSDDDCGAETECVDRWYWWPGDDGVPDTEDDIEVNLPTCRGKRCTSANDCAEGWSCLPEDNNNGGELGAVELRCRPTPVDVEGGEACNGSCHCAIFGGIATACFAACAVDADCSVDAACVPGIMWTWGINGMPYRFDACLPAAPP